MADEKTITAANKAVQKSGESKGKVSFLTKIANFFKNLPKAIARPFKNMWHELKKVTWPTREDLIKYSLIVLAFLVFMGIVIGLLDLGSSALVKLFL